jgi:hypothetical protein
MEKRSTRVFFDRADLLRDLDLAEDHAVRWCFNAEDNFHFFDQGGDPVSAVDFAVGTMDFVGQVRRANPPRGREVGRRA